MTKTKNPIISGKITFLQQNALLEFDNIVGTNVHNKAIMDACKINKPKFYPQQIIKLIPEITSRKLNDWDEKGLLAKHRQNKSGWRLFSIADVVRLRIIQDLKTYGMANEQVKKAINDVFELNDSKRLFLFETYLQICATANKVVILVEYDGSSSLQIEDSAYVNLRMNKNCSKPIIILPFYDYCLPFMPHKEYNMTVNTCDVVNEQNRASLDVIADKVINRNNKSINIRKQKRHDKESLVIKTTSIEENVKLSDKELIERLKQPYTIVIPYLNDDGTYNITTEVTDKI